MVTSYARGHKIYFDKFTWRYVDNDNQLDEQRPCARCGRPPTPEGYDACIGYVPGAASACCGHGVEEPHILYVHNDKEKTNDRRTTKGTQCAV